MTERKAGKREAGGRRGILSWTALLLVVVGQAFVIWVMCFALVTARDGRDGQLAWGSAATALAMLALLAWAAEAFKTGTRLAVRLRLGAVALVCDLIGSGVARPALARWNPGDDGPGLAWGFASTLGIWSVCVLGAVVLGGDALLQRRSDV